MTLRAIIEPSETGEIWIRSEEIPCYAVGNDEESAKEDFRQCLEEMASFLEDEGDELPRDLKLWKEGKADFEYLYDIGYFFEKFPFINVSAFAEEVGINPALMRNYKNRHAFASLKQKQKIQKGLDNIIARLSCVKLC